MKMYKTPKMDITEIDANASLATANGSLGLEDAGEGDIDAGGSSNGDPVFPDIFNK